MLRPIERWRVALSRATCAAIIAMAVAATSGGCAGASKGAQPSAAPANHRTGDAVLARSDQAPRWIASTRGLERAGGRAGDPDGVIAVLDLPSVEDAGTLPDLLGMIAPQLRSGLAGSGLRSVLELVGNISLDGVDRRAPVRVVVLDPRRHARAFVFVVEVQDRGAFATANDGRAIEREGDAALVGDAGALASLSASDRAMLATLYPVAEPEIVVYMRALRSAYGSAVPDLLLGLGMGGSGDSIGATVGRAAANAFAATERVIARGRRVDGVGTVELLCVLDPSSEAAAMSRAQVPAPARLLRLLPATRPDGAAVWAHLQGEAFRQLAAGFAELVDTRPSREAFERWLATVSGSIAIEVSARPSALSSLAERPPEGALLAVEIADPASAAGALRDLVAAESARDAGGPPAGRPAIGEAFDHRGVRVSRAGDPAPGAGSVLFAMSGSHQLAAWGVSAEPAMRAALDVLAGVGPVAAARANGLPAVAARVQTAVTRRAFTRRDSALAWFRAVDIPSTAGGAPAARMGVAVGLGFPDGNIAITVELVP